MTIDERIGLLEKDLRRMKRLNRWCVLLLLLAVGGFVAGFTQQPGDKLDPITTTELRIVDAAGKPRTVLNADKEGPRLLMHGENGNSDAMLKVGKDGPFLTLVGKKDDAIMLFVNEEGPRLWMTDTKGRIRTSLDMTKEGPRLLISDENNKTQIILSGREPGPFLGMSDASGKLRISQSVEKAGPSLVMADEKGVARFSQTVDKDDARWAMCDKNGTVRIGQIVGSDGPGLQVLDENGKCRTILGVSTVTSPDGTKLTYPESTFLLRGPDAKILWKAP
jgi:hypothetical protein